MTDYATEDHYERVRQFQDEVDGEVHRLRIRKTAGDQFRAENQPGAPPFDAGTLAQIIERPAEPPHRVEGLIPWEAGTLIVAQRKTGKTTLELNLARSLITGEDFLDRFGVRKIDGRVGILNYEVSAAQISRWAYEAGCEPSLLYLVNLRGRRNPLGDPHDRALLAQQLRANNIESLIVDPFGRAYTGLSQTDPGEVGKWLSDLDVFARSEVGAVDVILTAHAGWNGERTRGSSALEDWPDSIITLTRDPKNERIRYLKGEGRDVDVEEDQLRFDTDARRLSLTGNGSRKTARAQSQSVDLAAFVVRASSRQPGLGVAEMVAAIRRMPGAPPFRDSDVSKAAKLAAAHGQIRLEGGGPGKKTGHFPTPSNPVQTTSMDVPPTPSHPVFKDGVGVGGAADQLNWTGLTSAVSVGAPTVIAPPLRPHDHWTTGRL